VRCAVIELLREGTRSSIRERRVSRHGALRSMRFITGQDAQHRLVRAEP